MGQRFEAPRGLPRSDPCETPRASTGPGLSGLKLAQGVRQSPGDCPPGRWHLSQKGRLKGDQQGQQQQHFAPLIAHVGKGASAIRSTPLHERSSGARSQPNSREIHNAFSAPMQVASPSCPCRARPPGGAGVRLAAGRLPGQVPSAEGARRRPAEDAGRSIVPPESAEPRCGGPHSQPKSHCRHSPIRLPDRPRCQRQPEPAVKEHPARRPLRPNRRTDREDWSDELTEVELQLKRWAGAREHGVRPYLARALPAIPAEAV